MKFEKEFRKAFSETVGETDREFDGSNYTDWLESLANWLESLVEAQKSIDNKAVTVMALWQEALDVWNNSNDLGAWFNDNYERIKETIAQKRHS